MAFLKGYCVMLIIGFIIASITVYLITNSPVRLLTNSPAMLWKPHQEYCSCAPVPEIPTRPVKTKQLGRDHFFLVVLILSRPSGKERRDAIRQTWIKGHQEKAQGVLVKFPIGTEGISTQVMDNLTSEESIDGDLLLLPHLKDSYNNLTRKILDSFVEINDVYNFSYLLKCDDDTFVVLDTILSELAQRESKKAYYWGSMFQSSPVAKTGKWAETKWFLCETFLPYASGGGYILSQNLVRHIAINSDILRLYHNEDVSVGVWISPYDIDRRHDSRFNVLFPNAKCHSTDIAIHYQTTKDMIIRQKSYDEHKVMCT